MILIAITLMLAIGPFTVLHIYPIIVRLNQIIKKKAKDSTNQHRQKYYKKLIHWPPLICTGVVTCASFLVIHILSIVNFIEYNEEVLRNERYNRIMGVMYAILSLLAIIIGIVFSATVSLRKISNLKNDDNKALLVTAVVISANLIYVGCYFLPYMAWSFIHSPLLTIFTYLMGWMLIVCIYLICLGVWRLYKFFFIKNKERNKVTKLLYTLLYCCMGWAIAFSFIIFLFVNTYVITLEEFDDFEELKSIAPSLLIAVFGLFLVKPAYQYIKSKEDDNNKDEDLAKQGSNIQRQFTTEV